MRISDIPLQPDLRMLRQFAGLSFVVFGGWALFRFLSIQSSAATGETGSYDGFTIGLAVVGVGIGLAGIVYPKMLKPVFVGWMVLAFPVGWLVSHILLAAIFFGIFFPMGMILRFFGHDPLLRRRPRGETYWCEKRQQDNPRRYLKQF